MKKLAMLLLAAGMSFGLTGCLDELFETTGGGSCGSYGSCTASFGTGYACYGGTESGYCYSTSSYCSSDCE